MSNQRNTIDTGDKYVREVLRKNGMTVQVKDNDMNKALRRLKKLMITERVLQDVKKKSYHVTKGEKKRLAKKAAISRRLKEARILKQSD